MGRAGVLLAVLFLFLFIASSGLAQTASPQIWFCGVDPLLAKDNGWDQPTDYLDLFKPDAPWADTASGISVFKIYTRLVMKGTDEDLQTVIDGLKARHLPMAIELGPIPMGGPDDCGFAMEGYSKPLAPDFIAKKILKAGGKLDYLAMDEPVWYGHIDMRGKNGHTPCQYSVSQLADLIAPRLTGLRKYFPDLKVGDIEPVNSPIGGPGSIDDIMAFVDALRKETGTDPSFVDADVMWRHDGWQPLLEDLAGRLHAEGIQLGVICDGDPDDTSGEEWVSKALDRAKTVVGDPQIKPDVLIVQSWQKWPTKLLPETDPGSLTYEARQIEGWFQKTP